MKGAFNSDSPETKATFVKLRATALFAVASFFFVHFLFWAFPPVFESWNSQIIDRMFVLRASIPSFRPSYDSTVVHVDLSDRTIASLGSFYLTRSNYAQVIRNLGEMGVAAQAWDYIFPGRTTPAEDSLFADATRSAGNVFFGMKFTLTDDLPAPEPDFDYVQYLRATSWDINVHGSTDELYQAGSPITTLTEFTGQAGGQGYLSLKFDRDGVFRKAPLLARFGGRYYPSFAFRVACRYLGVTPDRITLIPGEHVILHGARVPGEAPKDIPIPIDEKANIVINWIGPWSPPSMLHYDFGDILRASDDRDELELFAEELGGKIVVVAEVATGSADVGPVPTDNNFPLSGLHANVISSIISGQFIWEIGSGWMILIEAGVVFLLVVFATRLSSVWLTLSMAGILALYLVLAALLFMSGIVLDPLHPSLMIVVGMLSIVGYRFFDEEKNKEALRRSFEAYFPPTVVRRIMANPELIMARGQKKELTILFSDIKSFTTYSSTMKPDEIQRLLNEYFGMMVDIVFKHEGTVDKFIGDGLMVFFGDPEPQSDHARRGVLAAIEMQKKTRELKKKWEAEGRFPIQIRIGINTGPVVVGNMGSPRRLSYTVLGADVNLAQRLESNAPVDGIMISQRTYELVKDDIRTRPLEPVNVKGLDEAIRVWEVVVDDGNVEAGM